MKIAQIGPVWDQIPPNLYGGTERVVSDLTEELVRRGHNVTLFATANSTTKAHLVSFVEQGVMQKRLSYNDYLTPLYHSLNAINHSHDFDIIHFHFTNKFDFVNLALVKNCKNVVFTLHIPLHNNPEDEFFKKLWEENFNDVSLVSISDNQRANFKVNFISTVYNSVDEKLYSFNDKKIANDMLWLSRVSPLKGTYEALNIAKDLNRKINLVGRVNYSSTNVLKYFEEKIKPLLNNQLVNFVEDIDTNGRVRYYQSARLFLFPIQWEEPFGLVMIESMACGTPVVAFARGSVPEVVKDGITGFIVNSSDNDIRGNFIIKKTGMEGLKEAVERIYAMPEEEYRQMRLNSRKHVEDNFTIEKMVDGYEKAYEHIMKTI